jgi:hypothetical protein
MATSSGRTALRRLQQSHARDHHHAEYANGFHSFNVRLNVASGKLDDQSFATCIFGREVTPNLPFCRPLRR